MTVEGFAIRASRDMGQVVPGGDVPIDVWVTDGSDAPSSVAVVRFWIGQKDARGSVKARAEIENPDQPNHWHTHVEAPNPMPPDAVLWVEMETGEGKRLFASFPLLP